MAKYEFKDGYFYAESHEWVKVEDDIALVGISDYAQGEMGDLVYAEGEPEGEEVEKGDAVGSIESVKMATDIYAPVDGEIIESNEDIQDTPEEINEKPFDTWIVKIKMSNPDQVNELMDAAAYEKFCDEE